MHFTNHTALIALRRTVLNKTTWPIHLSMALQGSLRETRSVAPENATFHFIGIPLTFEAVHVLIVLKLLDFMLLNIVVFQRCAWVRDLLFLIVRSLLEGSLVVQTLVLIMKGIFLFELSWDLRAIIVFVLNHYIKSIYRNGRVILSYLSAIFFFLHQRGMMLLNIFLS